MAKSFHSGGTVNATNWSVYAPGSVYTPGYSMVTTRQALNGTRPIQLTNWAPDYATGSYSASLHYPSSVSVNQFFSSSGGSYTFRVTASSGTVTPGRSVGDGFSMFWDSDGSSVAGGISHTVYYNEVPGAPTITNVTPSGSSDIHVAWTAPADNGGTAVTNYLIRVSSDPTFATVDETEVVAAPGLSGTVTGLTAGTWYVQVLAENAVSAHYSTYGPPSATSEVMTGPVWAFAGLASYQARVTDGGSYSDPGGPFEVYTRIPVSAIPIGLEVYAHIAFYVENPYNGTDVMAYPSIRWFASDGRLLSETADPPESVPAETTHIFTSPVLGRPREANYAEIAVNIPRFHTYPDPNVTTISPYDPDYSTRFYLDGVMISNRQVAFFDGSFADSGWFGTPGLSPSYQILGDSEPLFDMETDGGNKILSVSEGESKEETIRATVYPLSIDQPIPSDTYPTPLGAYNLLDSTDAAVPADVWSSAGGYVQVRPGDEWGQFVFTLYAPDEVPGYTGPFRIATRLGNTDVAAMKLSGRGVRDTPKTLRWPTGADSSVTTEVGASIASPALATLEDAYESGPWVVQSIGGPNVVLTSTLSLKDAQGFGVLPGSLIRYRESQYRVTGVTINGLQVQITAEWFVRIEEADVLWAGEDIEDRDAVWVGRKMKDRTIAPLKT